MIDGYYYLDNKRLIKDYKIWLVFNFYQLLDGDKQQNARDFVLGKYLNDMDKRALKQAEQLAENYYQYFIDYADIETELKDYDDSCSTSRMHPSKSRLSAYMKRCGWEKEDER